jgi:phosphoenolpyruvate---glycerone phosphotransferase subunit DhaL
MSAPASARATANLKARMGRASYLGERALGTPDAGAMGMALLFWALAAHRHPDRCGELPDPTEL